MHITLHAPSTTKGTLAVAGVLGIVLGLFVLHPLTMAIYWFEFHPEVTGISTVWYFVAHRMQRGFTVPMLPMTSVFAVIGAANGLAFGAVTAVVARRQRTLNRLERELGRDIHALLVAGESETLEFKATLRVDLRDNRINHVVERATVKTIAGFLNHRGGSLLLGVDDAGKVVGIEKDYATFRHKNRDGFELCLMGFVEDSLGADFCSLVHIVFQTVDGRDVCRVVIEASSRPAYVRDSDTTQFYLRTGNATMALDVDEAIEHIARQTRHRSGA